MQKAIATETFSNFSVQYIRSKLNKYKKIIINDPNLNLSNAVDSLKSRLVQFKKFTPPTFSLCNSNEWKMFHGQKLLRQQAKEFGLLGSIIPYNLEGQSELTITFQSNNTAKRGNIILSENMLHPPKIKYNFTDDSEYSFLLIDCDYSIDGKIRPFLLWMISSAGSSAEKEVFPYIPPITERGSGIHRIIGIATKNCQLPTIGDRNLFEIHDLFSENAKIVAFNFFQTFWTKAASESLKTLNKKERIFDPFIFGCLSSSIACILLQPLDVIKTRLQEKDIMSTPIKIYQSHQQPHCHKLMPIAKNIYSTGGYRGYWRGLSPTFFRNAPGTGLYFWILELLRRYDSSNSPISNLVHGMMARAIAGQLLMPLTVIKIRQESEFFSSEKTASNTIVRIYRKDGFAGFYRGSVSTMIRDAPQAGIFYLTYQKTKSFIHATKYRNHTDWCNFLSSINATFVSMILTHPFDVVKTRVQLLPGQSKFEDLVKNMWTVQ